MSGQTEKIRSEKQRMEEFFGLDISMPDLERTWGVPELEGEGHSQLSYNPVFPGSEIHEFRHKAHRDTLKEVISGSEDEVKEYCLEELSDLEVPSQEFGIPTSYYSAKQKFFGEQVSDYIDGITEDDSFEKKVMEVDDAGELADLVFLKNAETGFQPEIFAENSRNRVAGLFGASSLVYGINSVALGFIAYNSGSPEIGAGAALVFSLACFYGEDALDASYPEPLIEDTLEDYSKPDRRKAMFYNAQVDKTVDEFLETLNSYKI
ncbi:MAG: hypothetical protein ABEK10_03400 [Candidatus Nanosalina sp.]